MASDWEVVSLVEHCKKIGSGATPKGGSSVYLEEGEITLVRSQNIYNDGFKRDGLVFITEEAAEKLKNVIVEENDILLNITGDSVARVCMVDNQVLPARVNQHVSIIRPKESSFNPLYLRYQLVSPQVQQLLLNYASAGATRHALTKSMIENLGIPKPDLDTQNNIAHILGSLDDKIELNRQMNETLEAMAQALFKSWFVDFDPVIDNALAAGNAIPDEFAERAEQRKGLEKKDNSDIQNLFPDEFEFTEEVGWIPKGWEIANLKDHAEKISKGTTPSKAILAKADDDSTIPFIKVRDLDDKGKIDTQNLDLIPKSIHENALKRSILQTGDLLFSIAGTIGRVSIVPKELDNSNSNQALAFIRPKDDIKTYFLLQFLKSQEVQDEISSRVVQAVQANVSLTELGSLKFATASDDLFRKWHSIVQSWNKKMNLLRIENSNLSKLRDTLLPKLMSGELCISDAAVAID